jgi:hypothetical protein
MGTRSPPTSLCDGTIPTEATTAEPEKQTQKNSRRTNRRQAAGKPTNDNERFITLVVCNGDWFWFFSVGFFVVTLSDRSPRQGNMAFWDHDHVVGRDETGRESQRFFSLHWLSLGGVVSLGFSPYYP